MKYPLVRLSLAAAALIQFAGGVIHAAAFPKAESVLDNTNAPAFYVNSSKALWLADSATLIAIGVVLTLVAIRPAFASRWIVALLAPIPLGTATLIYVFVGSFFPAHMLVGAAALMLLAAWRYPQSPVA